ncbi:sigma-70 family RNA polymerase sigma factor [Flavobacterium sedimenticola]|uniref:Sigma-70 family RNA polymerase sigma factor n=1 Tax=Flavobacterium sedimenticola TaxID=3043286 RepID=A0ABT6XQA5_9FLAO|nr:sigma-70 family RNA polymerase sigma factor [Flavobacterium sedimenticola]MDI9257275.1 sigma-70 family RNA polymerase sigma factor [Flavobacterium sedimenticola]
MRLNQNYYKDLSKLKQLTEEETQQLFKDYQNGDQKAYETLITSNLRLVVYYAKQFYKEVEKYENIDYDDLISEGNVGLINAVKNYKLELDVKFSYYAGISIKRTISTYILTNIQNVRIPLNVYRSEYQINKVANDFLQKNHRPMTQNDLEAMNLFSKDQISDYFKQAQFVKIDDDIDVQDTLTQFDLISEQEQTKLTIESALNQLKESHREIIINVFGIGTTKISDTEMAKRLGVTKQNIGDLKRKALKSLKKILNNE